MGFTEELVSTTPPYVRGPVAARWYVWWFYDPLKCMRAAYERFGPLVAIGPLNPWRRRDRKYVLAIGPEMNRLVLGDAENFRTGGVTMRGPPGSALNRIRNGIHRMTGERHRQQRKLINPVFCRKAVEGYCQQIAALTGRFVARWQDDQSVDLSQQMLHLSLQISSQLLFGREDPQRAFKLGQMLELWVHQTYDRGLWLVPFNLPGTAYRRRLEHGERIVREILAMIDDRRRHPAEPDMLDMLVRTRDADSSAMTDDDVLGQTAFLFAASYETVANALTWTMFLVAQHPQVAAGLLDELTGEGAGEPACPEALERLPLLDAVIKESLRMLPPVPMTLRYATRPLELAGLKLRRADRVICSHYVTHHLPELFPEPERFDPARWETIRPGPFEYLPFGAGPHYCAGSHLATTMMKLVLSVILPAWRLEVVPQARIDRSIRVTLGPKFGMPVVLHRQDRCFSASPVRGNIHEMVQLEEAGPERHAAKESPPSLSRWLSA